MAQFLHYAQVQIAVKMKAKVGYLLQPFLHQSEALYNLGSGSWLAWANDTAAHYAAVHCPCQRTIGPAVCS